MLLTQGERYLAFINPEPTPRIGRQAARSSIWPGQTLAVSPALVPGLPLPRSGRSRFGIVRVPAGMPRGAEESRQAWDSPPTHPPSCRGAPHLPRPGRFSGLSPGATVTPTGHLEPCTPSRPAAGKSAPYVLHPPGSRRSPAGPLVRQKGPALKRCPNSNKRESLEAGPHG